jgi:hypothetical protein
MTPGLGAGLALAAIVSTAGFGAFVSGLGLYYDDWPSWYLHLTGGPAALVAFAAGQARPLVGLLPALAGSPAGSHLWMAAVHAANAALVLLVLRRVWPGQPSAAALAAALYAVYPNYWIRPTHIALAIDGSLFLALLSLWLGLVAVDGRGARRGALTLVSVLLVPTYLLLYELPLGLELARPVLFALRPGAGGVDRRGRFRAALRDGLPWLAVLALFVAWRVLVFRPTGDYARWRWNEIATPASPVGLALTFLGVYADQVAGTWTAHILATPWRSALADGGAALAAAVAAVAACPALARRRGEGEPAERRRAAATMGATGLAVVVLGQLTQALTGKIPETTGLNSRWGVVSAVGAALLWTALLEVLPASRPARVLGRGVLVLLVGLGTFWHARNALDFARDWRQQRDALWQLAWRAPAFEPGTVLLLDWQKGNAQDRPLYEYETTMAADLFYGAGRSLPAATVSVARDGEAASGNPRVFSLAGREWKVDLGQGLVAWAGESGCLELLGRGKPAPEDKPLSDAARALRHRGGRPAERVREALGAPPRHRVLFGPEPPPGWCFHYQRARLAQEQGDWEGVARLGDAALARGLRPLAASETTVFAEGYARARGAGLPEGLRPR